MKFSISNEIFTKYPSLHIGAMVVRGIDNTGENPDVLSMISEQSERIRSTYDLAALKENPVFHTWREAYRAFGAKPKKYTCSVENLYRMILEGIELKHINKMVDIYNYISLKYMVPVGGDDIDHVDGSIMLRIATGEEDFIRLNSDTVNHPKPGEVVYADDKEILCRRWNWRECDKSKMTDNTKNCLLVIESLSPITSSRIEEIMKEFSDLIQKYCGGTITQHILHKDNAEIEIS